MDLTRQGVHIYRFLNITIAACLQGALPVTFHDIGCHCYNWHAIQPGQAFDLVGQGVAIHLWKVDVHQDQIRLLGVQQFQGAGGTLCFEDLVTLSLKNSPDEQAIFLDYLRRRGSLHQPYTNENLPVVIIVTKSTPR
jgi:hypothetical protein